MQIQCAYIVLQYTVLGVILTSKENNIGLQVKARIRQNSVTTRTTQSTTRLKYGK
jgi:hypothetical protein